MRQTILTYQGSEFNKDKLIVDIARLKSDISDIAHKKVLFKIYLCESDEPLIEDISLVLDSYYPEAEYVGLTTNSNIVLGKLEDSSITFVCNIFEDGDTDVKVFQYELTDTTQDSIVDDFTGKVEENPWINFIEMFENVRDMSITHFCDKISHISEEIDMVGAGAFDRDLNYDRIYVFSKGFKPSTTTVAFVCYGGKNLHTKYAHISGWKAFGKQLLINKSYNNIIYEIDGKPAYETYRRYLKIKNDDYFYNNVIEFPLLCRYNGVTVPRVPAECMEDGSLLLASDVVEGTYARLAYGDPQTIMQTIKKSIASFDDFIPETISMYNCASRRFYWGDDEIDNETVNFNDIAPTTGFYTSGEFVSINGKFTHHNVTLIVVGMREGERDESKKKDIIFENIHFDENKISMVRRLANYINEAFFELELANNKLKEIAITDGLTKVFYRREIQRRIEEAVKADTKCSVALIMMDIDNFKKVNDTYGHKVGDNVLIKLSEIMKDTVKENFLDASVGRWGGEEFMILLPDTDKDSAINTAELIRRRFNAVEFEDVGKISVSCGVALRHEHETTDDLCIRVDKFLYDAKASGKNCVKYLD